MESTQDIKTLLTGTPISTVIPSRPLVHLGHTASIGDVLELLSSHGILSAPVFTANAEGVVEKPGIGTLLGFVDVWAVLVAFLQSLPAGRWTRELAQQPQCVQRGAFPGLLRLVQRQWTLSQSTGKGSACLRLWQQ